MLFIIRDFKVRSIDCSQVNSKVLSYLICFHASTVLLFFCYCLCYSACYFSSMLVYFFVCVYFRNKTQKIMVKNTHFIRETNYFH
ncbi:hypothetical protein HanIR_Chr04g0199191 [Helianthus annuus]|nr:hypothetical protein HanIR_Chr04g0199191 [Helianthus annuus]